MSEIYDVPKYCPGEIVLADRDLQFSALLLFFSDAKYMLTRSATAVRYDYF